MFGVCEPEQRRGLPAEAFLLVGSRQVAAEQNLDRYRRPVAWVKRAKHDAGAAAGDLR